MSGIPQLHWTAQGPGYFIAWINDTEFYSIKPVMFIGNTSTMQFEVHLNNAATGASELVVVGYDLADVEAQVRAHVGDS